ncbi:DUF4142 domain-containing protein [Alienimonas californiensis]|uniref:DUF4142 domain-containing protein n=1 Tax=Alienimonas californiensis TaxID=2527989 RepID=A0A517P400_9PLAN|nr:DUF4142 domain-containing protein [Alienimonas californiensis]QDT14075.1 hypothetical protein CA12_01430 [Alienimonas californiensis]
MFRPVARSLSAALAAGLCCAPALAAPQEREARDRPEARAAAGQTAAVPDRQILSFLTPMNRMEVDLSKFAAERAVTPEVKEYAKQMVADHEKLASDLQRAARRSDAHGALTPEQRRRAEAPLRNDGPVTEEGAEEIEEAREERAEVREEARERMREQREEVREERVNSLGDAVDEAVQDARELGDRARQTGRQVRTEAREGAADLARRADRELNEEQPARGMNRGRGAVNLRTEAMAKAHADVKEALGRQQGKSFDMAYLNQQWLAHIHMHSAVQVAADHAGPELKTVLDDAEKTIQGHLERTRELAMKVDQMED